MKLNHECVRDMLLTIEEISFEDSKFGIDYKQIQAAPKLKKYQKSDLDYTLIQLVNANFIDGTVKIDMIGNIMDDLRQITWEGHKFLDSVRDNKVWSDTKKIVSKFSSVSLTLVENVATNVITQIIKSQLNLEN